MSSAGSSGSWAWKNNPHGMFADWNPNVSCEEYTAEEVASAAVHSQP